MRRVEADGLHNSSTSRNCTTAVIACYNIFFTSRPYLRFSSCNGLFVLCWNNKTDQTEQTNELIDYQMPVCFHHSLCFHSTATMISTPFDCSFTVTRPCACISERNFENYNNQPKTALHSHTADKPHVHNVKMGDSKPWVGVKSCNSQSCTIL